MLKVIVIMTILIVTIIMITIILLIIAKPNKKRKKKNIGLKRVHGCSNYFQNKTFRKENNNNKNRKLNAK